MSRKPVAFLNGRNTPEGLALSWYLSTPSFMQVERGELDPEAIFFRLLRRQCHDAVWGSDYAECFDGLDPGEAEVVFEGTLPPVNRRKYEFVDRTARCWETYAYWVASPLGPATGPLPLRRVDGQAWWSRSRIHAEIEGLRQRHPELCRPLDAGTTCLGTALPAVTVGNTARTVALVGATHAGESGPELILGVLAHLLECDGDLLTRVGVVALPVVNVDARERLLAGAPWYGRVSAAGVDLNRNFPADWEQIDYSYGLVSSDPEAMTYRGPAPASEAETRAVMALLERYPPRAVFSYHCLGSITGAGFLTAGAAAEDRDYLDRAQKTADAYLEGFASAGPPTSPATGPVPPHPDEPSLSRPTSPAVAEGPSFSRPASPPTPARVHTACTAGSLPAWVYRRFGVPCFDLEKASDHPAEVAAVTCSMTPEMLQEYQEKHYRGVREVLVTELAEAEG